MHEFSTKRSMRKLLNAKCYLEEVTRLGSNRSIYLFGFVCCSFCNKKIHVSDAAPISGMKLFMNSQLLIFGAPSLLKKKMKKCGKQTPPAGNLIGLGSSISSHCLLLLGGFEVDHRNRRIIHVLH